MEQKDTSVRDTVIQACLQLVPYVGSSISTLYFNSKQEKRFKRIESFYEEIKTKINESGIRIPEISIHDPDYLTSILEKLHDKIETEHIQIKRECYKAFYIRNLQTPINSDSYDERALYLSVLDNLTELQMQIFVYILQQPKPIIDKTIIKPGTSDALVQGAIAQLKLLGLIDSRLHGIVFGGSGNAVNEEVTVSPFGKSFHAFCMT